MKRLFVERLCIRVFYGISCIHDHDGVDHLSKDFVIRGKKLGEKSKLLHALSDVSFDIYEGETLAIVGDRSGGWLVELYKTASKRGFAASGLTDDAKGFTLINIKKM